jgi:hypothetical protein
MREDLGRCSVTWDVSLPNGGEAQKSRVSKYWLNQDSETCRPARIAREIPGMPAARRATKPAALRRPAPGSASWTCQDQANSAVNDPGLSAIRTLDGNFPLWN